LVIIYVYKLFIIHFILSCNESNLETDFDNGIDNDQRMMVVRQKSWMRLTPEKGIYKEGMYVNENDRGNNFKITLLEKTTITPNVYIGNVHEHTS
jgi:hypothetical protein